MIVLKTNLELKLTFERLIKTMDVPVEWNGRFVTVGDYLILEGRVRSLFFNFESRKVITNIIEIPPVKEEEIIEIGDNTKIQNVLNLALYAFGKWGMIHGLKVEKDYAQLNVLFTNVLKEFSVEPGYSQENFRFYKEGIRVNYEDVIQLAIEAKEDNQEEGPEDGEATQGLWHKLVWKRALLSFHKTETTFEERQKERAGNNFYAVGYQCPKCKNNLNMVVFPVDHEFRIETVEGGVLLARAYTCTHCSCFYTPRPQKLLIEGDIYAMEFLNDKRAYEDYLELLGQNGDRVSNYKFNEYEDGRRNRRQETTMPEEETLEQICENVENLSDEDIMRLKEKIKEGFYPAASVKRLEGIVYREQEKRRKNMSDRAMEQTNQKEDDILDILPQQVKRETAHREKEISRKRDAGERYAEKEKGNLTEKQQRIPKQQVSEAAYAAAKRRFEAKFSVLDRLSVPQLTELKKQLEKDELLAPAEREKYAERLRQREKEKRKERIRQLSERSQGQNYAALKRTIELIEKEPLPEKEKEDVLEPLYKQKKAQGEKEVRQLIEKMPVALDMQQYHAYEDKLKNYDEVELSNYEEVLKERKRQAQSREISNYIRHSKTDSRQDMVDLMQRLKEQNFEEDLIRPYLNRIENKIRSVDEAEIAEICQNPMEMSADEVMKAYEKIENGVFLPELKTNALEMLTKRLIKIKTDECELLVEKLKESMKGKLKDNSRYHFYPARKVMTGEVKPEELQTIQYALDTYGTTRGKFEYPIVVIDTSKNKSGKEGMILTAEHLFYRTLFNAYAVSVADIRKVKAQTGLINGGLSIELRDGMKIKLPYAVERKELLDWGECLKDFIFYLQEKPDSRKLTYLAKEKHETICCYRCGYTYKGGQVCPKCGYKTNQ